MLNIKLIGKDLKTSDFYMHEKPFNIVKSFYNGRNVCVRVNDCIHGWFEIHVRVNQGCVMSPLLFDISMDRALLELYRVIA